MVPLIFCLFALLLPWSDGACDEGWSQHGNTCFYFSHTAASTSYHWHRARQFCRDQGAELASIHNQEEQKLIFEMASNASYRGGVWLGYNNLAQRGSSFSWSDGTSSGYSAWPEGEPAAQDDQRCVYTDSYQAQLCFEVHGNTTILPTSMTNPRYPPNGCRYLKQIFIDVRPNCRNLCKTRRSCDYYIAYLNTHDLTYFRGVCIECSKSSISQERHDKFAEYGEKRQCVDEFWHTANCGELKGFMCRKEVNSGAPPTIAPTPEVPGYCPHGFKGFGNKCYKVVTDAQVYWAEAVAKCRQEPGRDPDLAAINSPQEQAAVTLWLQDGVGNGVWLGGTRINGNWAWSDNSDPTYQHWGGSNYNDCMYLRAGSHPLGSWSSAYCTSKRIGYVCQTYKDSSNIQSTPGVPTPHPCPAGYTPYWYGCYKLQESEMSWFTAEASCVADGGHLVSMVSEPENAFVFSFAQKGLPLWIGLRQQGGEFKWIDGWPEVYTNWGSGQPANNQGCVIMDAGGTWNDSGCLNTYRSICKFTTVNTPTTPKPAEGSCPPPAYGQQWLEFGGHCYFFSPNNVRGWQLANNECKRLAGSGFNATLASIHNRVTNEWIQSYISETWPYRDGTYIGLERSKEGNSVWAWADGSPVNYFRWAPGEPSNEAEECVEFRSATWNGLWNDINCFQYRPYVCMTEKANNCDKENGWHHYKDLCYFVSNTAQLTSYSWYQAREYCHQRGADLASITDLEENAKIMDFEGVDGRYTGYLWHGYNSLRTHGSDWEWADGTNSSFTGWSNYQPSTDGLQRCAYVMPTATNPELSWRSDNCAARRGFVCKKDPENPVLPTVLPTEQVPGFCPPGYHGYSNKCYKLVDRGYSDGFWWQDARTECQADGFGADLASLTTPIEQAVVVSMLGNSINDFWIGLKQTNYKLYWVNNAEVGYTNLPDSNNNGQIFCFMLSPYSNPPGAWGSSSCYGKRGYICEAYKDMANVQPSSEPLPTTDCPEGYNAHNNGCYKLELIPRTWSAADLFCKKTRANLASIHDLTENSYLLAVAQNAMPIWIGLQNVAGEYKWTDGWPDVFTNWAAEEPTGGEGCVVMGADSKWNDTSCHLERPFFCKTTKEPIPTTPSPVEGICPNEDWQEWGGHCYYFSTTRHPVIQLSWSRAHDKCGELAGRAHKGALASIHDAVTNEWVRRNMYYERATRSWIGLTKADTDEEWTWDDRSAVSYVNFLNDDAPSVYDCASMYVDSFVGKWSKESCTYGRNYVCKAEKVPYPTTPTMPPEVAGECPSEEWTSFGPHCFLTRPDDHVPWVEALSQCKAAGGESLATVSDSAENWFLHQLLQADMDSSVAAWIGLSQKTLDDDWKWFDGTELSFTNFYSASPLRRERCATMRVSTGEWVTRDCLKNFPYVCKHTKRAVVTTAIPTSTEGHHDDNNSSTLSPGAISGIVIGILAAFALLGGVSFLILHFRKQQMAKNENSFDNHNYETMEKEK